MSNKKNSAKWINKMLKGYERTIDTDRVSRLSRKGYIKILEAWIILYRDRYLTFAQNNWAW